ncbi:LacI family DNA-binding transcriptional regulator [Lysinimonas soli]|uniref:LacI family DNA-binding transcriptional regulator n=1 Tax=Lysinimonas soli TaxID=1074233 RepID=A0ABW0NM80_9MICO
MAQSTIRDVARVANVSLGTVSNYLNGNKRISDATRQRIDAAIDELQFVRNAAVRVMQGGRSHVIAFIVPDGGNPFFLEVARGIEDFAIENGRVVVSCNTEGELEREKHYAKALSEMRVEAVIAVASATNEHLLSTLQQSGVRVVTLGRQLPGSPYPAVDVDDLRGGFIAMGHLLERGHRRVAFLGAPEAESQIRARYAGCVAAYTDAGLDASQLLRVDADLNSPTARSAASRAILALDPRPTAIVCANDVIALALEAEAIRAGLRIPADLAIVGYDDIEGAAIAPIPLTTVHQPRYDLGHQAAELALSPNYPVATVQPFSPRLVVREST